MRVSLGWLRELCDFDLTAIEVARVLTMAGIEVESHAQFGAFSGVVVAEVRGRRPHPNAAKLTLVDVWDGATVTQVVCGAANVPEPNAERRLVLWARPGARLPSGLTLAPKEVRGVVSPGMLCAEDELGLGSSHEGIVVLGPDESLAPGDDVAAKLGLPDTIFEVNVTPNRPDCLGHIGIARELAALTGGRLRQRASLERGAQESSSDRVASVALADEEGCPRYVALVMEGVRVGPSPLAQRLRLEALGMRALSNVVDATNLVMLETGQPLHAFDLDRLEAPAIVVRRARPNERMVTLDGVERRLESEDLVICAGERPVAVAGVMGGATSEVSAATTRLLIESAYFDPARVRRTAKRLGIHTEASHRFERGCDPNGALEVARRAAQVIGALAGGRAGRATDLYPTPIAPRQVTLRPARTSALLGLSLAAERQSTLLSAIGIEVEQKGAELRATVPTFRPDLTREIDLVEEIARLHGYQHIPVRVPPLAAAPGEPVDRQVERVRDAAVALGLDEVMTYGFVPPSALALLAPERAAVTLANPLREEQSTLRTTLLSGLASALGRNVLRGQSDVRLFEVGEVFFARGPKELPEERRRIAGILAGHREGWLQAGPELDFFDVKGVAESLLGALGHAPSCVRSTEPWLHPGMQARLEVAGKEIGIVGELHPRVGRALELFVPAFVFEIELSALPPAALPIAAELPRFPQVTRDLSFFIAEEIVAAHIHAAIDSVRDPLLVGVRVLEDYREPGRVPPGQKGMLWSFVYRAADRTLTDAEVAKSHEALVRRLADTLPLTLR